MTYTRAIAYTVHILAYMYVFINNMDKYNREIAYLVHILGYMHIYIYIYVSITHINKDHNSRQLTDKVLTIPPCLVLVPPDITGYPALKARP